MKMPKSVPPKPDLRDGAGRRLAAAPGGRWSVRASWRGFERCQSHLVRCADSQHGESVFHDLPRCGDERKARLLRRGFIDQKSLSIIVTVEFRGQFLEVRRHEVRRELARGELELGGESGQPPQERLLVRDSSAARARHRGQRGPPLARRRCRPAASPIRRERSRTARSRRDCRASASARDRCRT